MRVLYHYPLCPFSRKVRVHLAEKGLSFDMVLENFWKRRREFAKFNPAMQVPVLVEQDGTILPDSLSICEFLEDNYQNNNLIGKTSTEKAEVRRIISWFDIKFYNEVTKYLLNEKVIRYYTRIGEPSSDAIRAAKSNIVPHLKYIEFLTRNNSWLAGEKITLADISAACQLSVVDYMGEVPWDNYPKVKEWYALVKSRPSFRSLLADNVAGFVPPKCYADLDF